jgi:hypothetical protein
MDVTTVTAPSGGLLAAIRETLVEADEALLCVAFAQARGVHLIASELETVARRSGARVLVTTTLGATSPAALDAMHGLGVSLRTLNPGGGTYHPKVFLGRAGKRLSAVVGSGNLTSGLVANVEAGTRLRGSVSDAALARLWGWANDTWQDPRSAPWAPVDQEVHEEEIEPELLGFIQAQVRDDPKLYTLGPLPKPNVVREATPAGLWVETERSLGAKKPPQLIPPHMLNLAWDALRSRGELSNRDLLDELRVHRSSFVCAMLAKVPGVEVVSSRPVLLRYRP